MKKLVEKLWIADSRNISLFQLIAKSTFSNNYKKWSMIICLFFIANSLFAQKSIIASVEASVSQNAVEGCDNTIKYFKFTGVITANGPGTITYTWLRNDGAKGLHKTLVFEHAGTQIVSTSWTISRSEYEGWQALQIVTPDSIMSNKARFTIYCCNSSMENSCTSNPFSITSCGLNLIGTFKDLVSGYGTKICNSTVGSINVSNAMSLSCYGTDRMPGLVTYTAYTYVYDSAFHVIWGSGAHDNLAFVYYGACAPEPIIFPAGVGENHVFEAILVSQTTYKNSTNKEFGYLKDRDAIPLTSVDSIVGWYMESKNGYIATTEPSDYNSILSSKGIVVKVKMGNGDHILCYLLNNYDKAGTVIWKDLNNCPEGGNPVTPAAAALFEEKTSLSQNTPNPFINETSIDINLSEKHQSALLNIYNLQGILIKSIPVEGNGNVVMKISGTGLSSGMYFYKLFIDGHEAGSKSMIINK